jgi:hypothetical protein
MRRGSIFVILFALVALLIIGASQFLRTQPAAVITVAVSPLAEAWVRAAAASFNAASPLANGTQRVEISVQSMDDPVVWQDGTRPWSSTTHPDAWIPALAESVQYAADVRLPFEVVAPSVAQTPLVWGIFSSRAEVALTDASGLDWARVQEIAAAERWDAVGGQEAWQFVKIIFGAPERSAGGLGAVLSGAAAFAGDPALTVDAVNAQPFRTWMQPVLASVPNFNTLGNDPAAVLTRGASAGEIALLPESQWLTNLNGIVAREPILFSYPQYTLMYQFPLALWNDAQTTDVQRQGARLFADYLLAAAQQTGAQAYGLRPASLLLSADAALFNAGAQYGIVATPDLTNTIQMPPRDAIVRLLGWANSR